MRESFEPDDSLVNQCEKFICKEYDPKGNESRINKLRYKMFCRNPKKSENLPSCFGSLRLHIYRANYHCAAWRRALTWKSHYDSPIDRGWSYSNNALIPTLMSQDLVPSELVELTYCSCKLTCSSNICKCYKRKLICSDACKCDAEICHNRDSHRDESNKSDVDNSSTKMKMSSLRN